MAQIRAIRASTNGTAPAGINSVAISMEKPLVITAVPAFPSPAMAASLPSVPTKTMAMELKLGTSGSLISAIRSPSPHRFSTPSTATHPAPSMPATSPHSPVLPPTSTPPTTPPASAISAMRPSPSPTPRSPHRSSTPSTATPQAPSMPAPSQHSLWRSRRPQHRLRLLRHQQSRQ